ncbi:Tripartite ATP-independent transporter, DctM component [Salipiger thiooxidans]|uniref:Tripartite ATP-independent transporter, DctM component n=1 Tax=Salipiger thiooxidans TaxID=282683 RepID=A0A1G7FHR1_9RHOB|nr:TRAP transporter large permease subunit [Salipiger thiooxidans]SDE75428.1 Tripartite ATP-independent transporter, DctM component [Salipiger thiooxidans]
MPGIATPTDTAGMVVLYTAVPGALVYRELTPRAVLDAAIGAVLTPGAIMMTGATSQAFCSLVIMGGAGRMIQELLLSISQNRYVLPMVINVALLILGTSMDPLPVMLILSAILFPLMSGLGVDPEQLGDVTVFIPDQLLQNCRRRPHAPDPQSRGRRQVQHVAHYVVTADFGLALDKEGISEAAWDALPTEQQELLQTTFDEMEETAYSAAGNSGKEKDLAARAEANGPDPVIDSTPRRWRNDWRR